MQFGLTMQRGLFTTSSVMSYNTCANFNTEAHMAQWGDEILDKVKQFLAK